jgi:hypothetical protein
VVELHEKAHGRTVSAAAEAMIETLAGTYRERRCFFVVERAASLEFTAGLLELYAASYYFNDICSRDQIIDEILRNQSGHISSNVEPAPPGLLLLVRGPGFAIKGR